VDGGLHETVAALFAAAAVTFWGALGLTTGVTGPTGSEAGPVPTAFVAVTLKV
jgi:hypothetical protein